MKNTNSLLLRIIVIVLFSTLSSCSTVQYKSDPQLIGYTKKGQASYYAMKYQFRKTASGERFNQLELTGAHRTLPFGTKV